MAHLSSLWDESSSDLWETNPQWAWKYYHRDRDTKVTCPSCKWSGRCADCLCSPNSVCPCPKCGEKVVIVN